MVARDWRQEVPKLGAPHAGQFGGLTWSLRRLGAQFMAGAPEGTLGPPATALRVWQSFGAEITAVVRKHDVPAELIVATICTKSAGCKQDRGEARRVSI